MENEHQGWLCILNETNFEIVKDGKIYGVPPRAIKKLRQVSIGDVLLFYVITPVKCIRGISKVISDIYEERELAPWKDRSYPYRVRISDVEEVRIPIKDFVDRISSIKRRIPMGASLIPLTERDLDTILSLSE